MIKDTFGNEVLTIPIEVKFIQKYTKSAIWMLKDGRTKIIADSLTHTEFLRDPEIWQVIEVDAWFARRYHLDNNI